MPFTSGTFSLYTPGNPVVTGTTISSSWSNNTLTDIATGLSTAMLKDGTQTITANIPMSGLKFTALVSGSASGDSATYGQMAAVLISQASVAASSTASIEFTGLNSSFQQYMVRVSRLRNASASTTLWVRVSRDGTTYDNNGDYGSVVAMATAAMNVAATASASGVLMTTAGMGFGGAAMNAEILIDDPSNTTQSKGIRFSLLASEAVGGLSIHSNGCGQYAVSTSAISAISVGFRTGNIGSGVMSLYGIKYVPF